MSPTSCAVVAETLKKSLRIAAECQKQCIVATYDLAIAKMTPKSIRREAAKFAASL